MTKWQRRKCSRRAKAGLGLILMLTVEEAFDYTRGWIIWPGKATPVLQQIPQIKDSFVSDLLP